MNANDLRVGQLVSAADTDTMIDRCSAYTHYTIHGLIVAAEGHRVAVKWIDYRGPQHETYLFNSSLLRVGTLTAGTRTRLVLRRRAPAMHAVTISPAIPPDAKPSIEIRELKIYPTGTREAATGLQFHTVDDANIALHAIADAQEAFQPTFGPHLASSVAGGYIVAVYRATYTTLYRLDSIHVHHPKPTPVAG